MADYEIEIFERNLYGMWGDYERQYFDEESFKELVSSHCGYWDYETLAQEIGRYVTARVYLCAVADRKRCYEL